jgi:hypothetical protein
MLSDGNDDVQRVAAAIGRQQATAMIVRREDEV